jgi:hypothetical protein
VRMQPSESSRPSSMFTSMTLAPLRTCRAATATACSHAPDFTRRRNFVDPVTFVRSPTVRKLLSGRRVSVSIPASCVRCSVCGGTGRGGRPATALATAPMCAGVVPQQPPTRFTSPLRAHSPTSSAVRAGLSS